MFLALPPEVRNIIYTNYLRVHGGYTYNFATNQLIKANDQPIELALTLTCRQVAAEMRGLPLTLNNITFRTYHSEKTNEAATHFHNSLSTAQGAKYRLLDAMAPRYLTQDMAQTLARKYPFFRPILDGWRSDPPLSLLHLAMNIRYPKLSWGQPESLWFGFVDITLKLLSEHPEFPVSEEPQMVWWSMWDEYDATSLINMDLPPSWAVLGFDEAYKLQEDIASITGIHGYRHPATSDFPSRPCKYTYSAASLAVRFLDSTSTTTRKYIRNVLLDEDQESIANAPCHAQGLIPFCRENGKMVIKRNVNLWTACLYTNGVEELTSFSSRKITWAIGSWLTEALRLPKLGMPLHSFQLILDSGPLPKLAQSVFDMVGHDAGIQAAMDICYDRGKLARPSWAERCTRGNYLWEDLPQVYQDLISGKLSPLIHCNFDIDVGPDPEEIAEAWGALSLTVKEWEDRWWTYDPKEFNTEAPLPPLQFLRPSSLVSDERNPYAFNELTPNWPELYGFRLS